MCPGKPNFQAVLALAEEWIKLQAWQNKFKKFTSFPKVSKSLQPLKIEYASYIYNKQHYTIAQSLNFHVSSLTQTRHNNHLREQKRFNVINVPVSELHSFQYHSTSIWVAIDS
jgi:hypothetical protein